MKVLISGYGKMGHVVEQVLERRGIPLAGASEDVCAVDPALARECICIDFTTPAAFRANYPFLARAFKGVVVGTTGWDDIRPQVLRCFEQAGTPLIYASNFSIGVNALFAAVERAAGMLRGQGYTPSIEEVHHIHKLDAPSGTAKSLGVLVQKGLGVEPQIEAKRIGEVPGIHSVSFVSDCDRLDFRHEAFSREGLAQGAVAAALMLDGGVQGVHEFKDLL